MNWLLIAFWSVAAILLSIFWYWVGQDDGKKMGYRRGYKDGKANLTQDY